MKPTLLLILLCTLVTTTRAQTDTLRNELRQLIDFNLHFLDLLEKNHTQSDALDQSLIEQIRLNTAHLKLQTLLAERDLAETKIRLHAANLALEKEKKKTVIKMIGSAAGGMLVGAVMMSIASP